MYIFTEHHSFYTHCLTKNHILSSTEAARSYAQSGDVDSTTKQDPNPDPDVMDMKWI